MEEEASKQRFKWTAQIDLQARILAALGKSQREIATALGCSPRTIRKYIGRAAAVEPISFKDMLALYEAFDATRNLTEALSARSGSIEQVRLRNSLKAFLTGAQVGAKLRSFEDGEELSNEQICADLERLVGRPFTISGEL